MVAAMIALAHEAGLTAVAVGIETNRQLALARELDCSVGQGNLLHAARVAGAPASQGTGRDGNVRAMASARATGGSSQPALSDDERRRAPKARGRDRGRGDGRGRDARRAGHRLDGRLPARRRSAERELSGLSCVATSPATERAARALGLDRRRVSRSSASWTSRSTAPTRSTRGAGWSRAGAAPTRARRSWRRRRERFVVIVSPEKARAGARRRPVPLELLARSALADARCARLRADAPCATRRTSPDGGLIADYLGPIGDPAELAARLGATPGVVEHGLFAPEMVERDPDRRRGRRGAPPRRRRGRLAPRGGVHGARAATRLARGRSSSPEDMGWRASTPSSSMT